MFRLLDVEENFLDGRVTAPKAGMASRMSGTIMTAGDSWACSAWSLREFQEDNGEQANIEGGRLLSPRRSNREKASTTAQAMIRSC